MNKIRKIITLSMALIMIISLFSGCQGKDNNGTTHSIPTVTDNKTTESTDISNEENDSSDTTASITDNSQNTTEIKYEDFDINTLSDFSKINIKVEKTDNKYKTLKESSSSAFLVSVPSDKEITSSVTKEIKDSVELEKIVCSLDTLESHERDKFEVTDSIFSLSFGNKITYLRKDKQGVSSVLISDKVLSVGYPLTIGGKYLSADGKTLYVYTSYSESYGFAKQVSDKLKDTYNILAFSIDESEKNIESIVIFTPTKN